MRRPPRASASIMSQNPPLLPLDWSRSGRQARHFLDMSPFFRQVSPLLSRCFSSGRCRPVALGAVRLIEQSLLTPLAEPEIAVGEEAADDETRADTYPDSGLVEP